jgi:hypothetical protein
VDKLHFYLKMIKKGENILGGEHLTKKIDVKNYQKPELTHIDDSAFDEMGQGSSGFSNGGTNNGNHYGNHYGNGRNNNGNHYGGGYGRGRSHK